MITLPLQPKIILEDGNRAVFEIERLYPGYGQTIGNSIRRVMLSSLKGAAITSVKIEGVRHEFSTIEGVMEDVVDIILNLKQMRFRLHGEGPHTITLSVSGEKEVKGKDFKVPSQVEIVTPGLHIATITSKKISLQMEAVIESGFGYVPQETRTKEKVDVGTVALDAVFSPVQKVHYEVENMRVGDRTDFNKLRIDVTTDGSIHPREAFQQACNILIEQFQTIVEGFSEEKTSVEGGDLKIDSDVVEQDGESIDGKESEVEDAISKMKVEDLKLSSRTMNVLRDAGVKTVSGLSRKKESVLREIEGMGDKGIQEIKKALGTYGITLKQ